MFLVLLSIHYLYWFLAYKLYLPITLLVWFSVSSTYWLLAIKSLLLFHWSPIYSNVSCVLINKSFLRFDNNCRLLKLFYFKLSFLKKSYPDFLLLLTLWYNSFGISEIIFFSYSCSYVSAVRSTPLALASILACMRSYPVDAELMTLFSCASYWLYSPTSFGCMYSSCASDIFLLKLSKLLYPDLYSSSCHFTLPIAFASPMSCSCSSELTLLEDGSEYFSLWVLISALWLLLRKFCVSFLLVYKSALPVSFLTNILKGWIS